METSYNQNFKKEIKSIFRMYDSDGSGALDSAQTRRFLNDLRDAIYLSDIDDCQFNKVFDFLDTTRDGKISLPNLSSKLPYVYRMIQELGESMKLSLHQEFLMWDHRGSGFLEKDELRGFLNGICLRRGLEECQSWQIDYVISFVDYDGNGKLDLDEIYKSYRSIVKELVNHKKKQAEIGSDKSLNRKNTQEATKQKFFRKFADYADNDSDNQKIFEGLAHVLNPGLVAKEKVKAH
jgi:Ca2+-binding EF-hand superfamily protein